MVKKAKAQSTQSTQSTHEQQEDAQRRLVAISDLEVIQMRVSAAIAALKKKSMVQYQEHLDDMRRSIFKMNQHAYLTRPQDGMRLSSAFNAAGQFSSSHASKPDDDGSIYIEGHFSIKKLMRNLFW